MISSSKRRGSRPLLLLAGLVGAVFFAASARAAAPGLPGYTGPTLEISVPGVEFSDIIRADGTITIPWIAQYIAGAYTFLVSIAGLLAAVMMVTGGFQYVTAAGDKGKLGAAKKRITNAFIGLLLALGSYTILYTINPDLVRFDGLQLTDIRTVLIPLETGVPDELAQQTPSKASSPPSIKSGKLARFCDWVPGMGDKGSKTDCTGVCQSWGCGTAISETNCDFSQMPREATGAIDPMSPDLIPSSKWPSMKHVKPMSRSVKATSAVIEGLKRLDAYIDQNYAGQGYEVKISNCWRDWRKDVSKECGIVVGDHVQYKGGPIDKNPNNYGLAWPGVGPHSSGAACDMRLYKDGKVITGLKGGDQSCRSKRPGNELFVDMLTNDTVGAKRLNFEAWHFEWGGPTGCRCVGESCKSIWPLQIPKCSSGKNQRTEC